MLRKITLVRETPELRRIAVVAPIFYMLFSAVGCESFSPPKPARIGEEQRFLVHLVTNGNESFGKISKWYTGSEKFGKELAELNIKIGANGLQTGESVLIPFAKLKTVAPMPKIAGAKKSKSTKRGKKKGSTPTVIDSVELQRAEIENEPTSPELVESELLQNQTHAPSEVVDTNVTDEQQVLANAQGRDIVPLPTAPENEVKNADNLGDGGKSLEDLVREEQAELERLKREMDAQ